VLQCSAASGRGWKFHTIASGTNTVNQTLPSSILVNTKELQKPTELHLLLEMGEFGPASFRRTSVTSRTSDTENLCFAGEH